MSDGAQRVGIEDPEEGGLVRRGGSEALTAAKQLVDHVAGFFAGDIVGCGEAGASLGRYRGNEDFAIWRKCFAGICMPVEAIVMAVVQPWWGQRGMSVEGVQDFVV